MKIIDSKEMNDIINAKLGLGMRERIKKFCTKYSNTSKTDSVIEGMQLASEFTLPNEGHDLVVVKIFQGVLYSL